MEKGDIVKIRIKNYPYERTGVLVKKCKVHSFIKVRYDSKFMIIKKKNTELQEFNYR